MKLKSGHSYKDFLIKKVLPLPEIQATLTEAVYEPSGSSIIHLFNDDKENSFCLAFQTLPSSSNGVAHILEHLVLCGSKKYPVNDPFFSMTKRSLNTFMNAMTGSDFTLYLASSQIEKDFYHLLDVYLDAVFRPQLKKYSFLQEAHRLEFSKADDPKSPLEFKGVVYNEMKGAMSSPYSRLWKSVLKGLLPDLPYAHNSGGDPSEIPTLTYQELVDFYQNYYHPSHCLFYFYGNIPLQKHLDFLHKELLSKVTKAPMLPLIKPQKRFTFPKIYNESYPIAPNESLEKKTILAIGTLTCHVQEQEELLALCLLESILMETDASPLKHALLQSKKVGSFDSYIDVEMSEIPWIFVASGIDDRDIPSIVELFQSTLLRLKKEGFSKKIINAALHQLEFHRVEITEEGLPYGLHLFMRAGLIKLHGCDPESALLIHKQLDHLKKQIKDPQFLPDLLDRYLISNPHKIELTLSPDPKLGQKEASDETEILQEIKRHLTKDESNKIITQSKELKKYQEALGRADINQLPILDIADIPKEPLSLSLASQQKPLPTYFHDCFTNRIVYVDLIFDLPHLTDEELALLPFFSHFLTDLGIGKKKYTQVLEEMNAHTGGIEAFLSLNIDTKDPTSFRPSFAFKGKALYHNSATLFSLLKGFIEKPNFEDKERIKELLLQEKTHLEARKIKNAMHYAISLSLCPFSYMQRLKNLWYGYDYYENTQRLCQDLDQSAERLSVMFSQLAEKIFCHTPSLVIGCDQSHFDHLQKEHFYHIHETSSEKKQPKWTDKGFDASFGSYGFAISSPVAFTSMGLKTITYAHEHAPAIAVLCELLSDTILHEEIREKGGAYGAGLYYNPQSGNLYFTAYRDPNLAKTVEVFHASVRKISEGAFDKENLYEAKLSALQHLDTPISPGSRAFVAYSWHRTNKTDKQRQIYRKRLLSLTFDDLQQAALDSVLPALKKASIVSFADHAILSKEKCQPSLTIKSYDVSS
jgi:presequence protease